ncbi:MAG: hypothetical protein HYZ29_02330 [Myxococcales bacterium]|nr:hypothetical protein [Myxococcales bacterium]
MGALRFRLFGFPVEIQIGFWILALIIGLRPGRPWTDAAMWLGIIFLSIMVHELGHAFAARAYGQSPSIVLHMLGGVTSWSAASDLGKKRRILVTLAGPGAGFALGLVAYAALIGLSRALGAPKGTPWVEGLALLAFANVFWSVINLLPVLPFDGGQVLAAALGPERRKLAATVSLVFGVITAIALYRLGSLLGALLFAMGGVSNFLSAMQAAPDRPQIPPEAAKDLLAEAQRALEAGHGPRAATLASAALDASRDPAERKRAVETLVWAALLSGDTAAARNLVRSTRGALDPYVEAAVAEADGDAPHATRLLVALREQGDRRVEVAATLVRLLLKSGNVRAAADLALEIAEQVPDEDLERIARETEAGGEAELAAELRQKLAARSAA